MIRYFRPCGITAKLREIVSEWANFVVKNTITNMLVKNLELWTRLWTGSMPKNWTPNFLAKEGTLVLRQQRSIEECQTKYIGVTEILEQKAMFLKEETNRAQGNSLRDRDVQL